MTCLLNEAFLAKTRVKRFSCVMVNSHIPIFRGLDTCGGGAEN